MTSKSISLHGQDGFFYHTLPVVPRAQSAFGNLDWWWGTADHHQSLLVGKGVPRSQIPKCTGLDCPVEGTAPQLNIWVPGARILSDQVYDYFLHVRAHLGAPSQKACSHAIGFVKDLSYLWEDTGDAACLRDVKGADGWWNGGYSQPGQQEGCKAETKFSLKPGARQCKFRNSLEPSGFFFFF